MGTLSQFIAQPYSTWTAHFPGRRALGYVCTYAPLEVLHAAGFAPVRLMQLGSPVTVASGYVPPFSCALARGLTERLLTGELDFLSGVVFGHTCDTMQCLADIWRLTKPGFPILPCSVPTVLSASDAEVFMLTEMHRLAESIQTRMGAVISEEALRQSIDVYNRQRRLLAELAGLRSCFTAEEWWLLSVAGALIPIEQYNELLQQHLLDADEPHIAGGDIAVVVVGAILDDPLIPRLIDELGGRVVGDDLCTGRRYRDLLVDENLEPFQALAKRYLHRADCPTKHGAPKSRGLQVVRLVQEANANGVVFVLPKFCDPHGFDYVATCRLLDRHSIPHTLIETEGYATAGQVRTRLQAFFELLQSVARN